MQELVEGGELLVFFDAGGEFGVGGEVGGVAGEFAGVVAGGGDEAAVGEGGELEVEGAVLEGAVDFAWAAEFEVDFGEVEAVGGFGEFAEAARGGLVAGGE